MDNFFHQIVQKIIVILGLVPTLSVDERDIQLCSKYHNNCFKKTNILIFSVQQNPIAQIWALLIHLLNVDLNFSCLISEHVKLNNRYSLFQFNSNWISRFFSSHFHKICENGKNVQLFFIGVSYFLQFKSFLWQTIPDIISAYWVYCNVKVIAKKKAKTKLSPNILGIGYLNTTSQCTFIYFNEKSIFS